MIARFRSRYGRLRWKLIASYTTVAALTFFILQVVLLVLALTVFGINPLRADIGLISNALAPSLMADIEILSRAELTKPDADTAALQHSIQEKWADFIPQTAVSEPLFQSSHVMTVLILDTEQQLILSLPNFTQLSANSGSFDAATFADDSEYGALVTAVYANDITYPQPYSHLTPEAIYLNYAAPIRGDDGAPLGVQVMTLHLPTPTTIFLFALGMFVVGMGIFTLAAAMIGTLFGWRTARGFSDRLTHLAQRTAAWGQGDFSAQVVDQTEDEIGDLGNNLNQMATELQRLLADKKQLAVLEERNRLARDLHDSVKQQAFATAAHIGAARALVQQNPENTEAHLAQAADLTDQIRQELTTLIKQLRPSDVETKGLADALRDYAAFLSAQHNIQVTVDIPEVAGMKTAVADALFRITQEALANIGKYSRATQVTIRLTQNHNAIRFTVVDDGVGFDVATVKHGVGLDSMRERATAVNGNLAIESSQKGTKIVVEIK